MTRGRHARQRGRGFTLLEVMVAVAILGLGLTTIFAAQAGAFASAGHARNLSLATGLSRCRMSELETQLKVEGFQALDVVDQSGPCCDGEEHPKFSCSWRIEKLELPEERLGELNLDAGLDMSTPGSASGSSPGGTGNIDPLELAASAPSGAMGLMSLLGKSQAGSQSDISEVAATMAGDDADGAMGGIAEFVMGMVYPDLRTAFVEGSRRITVTIAWTEGSKEHAFDVTQWLVDARAAGLRMAAEGELEVVDEDPGGDTGTGLTPPGGGEGRGEGR